MQSHPTPTQALPPECAACREALPAVLARRASPKDRTLVSVHVSKCAACAELARELEADQPAAATTPATRAPRRPPARARTQEPPAPREMPVPVREDRPARTETRHFHPGMLAPLAVTIAVAVLLGAQPAAGRTALPAAAVLVLGDNTYTTDYANGQVIATSADGRLLGRWKAGRVPVALAERNGRLLVLDRAGAVIILNPTTGGRIAATGFPGHPERMAVANDGTVYVAGSDGLVTALAGRGLPARAQRRYDGHGTLTLARQADGRVLLVDGTTSIPLDPNLSRLPQGK